MAEKSACVAVSSETVALTGFGLACPTQGQSLVRAPPWPSPRVRLWLTTTTAATACYCYYSATVAAYSATPIPATIRTPDWYDSRLPTPNAVICRTRAGDATGRGGRIGRWMDGTERSLGRLTDPNLLSHDQHGLDEPFGSAPAIGMLSSARQVSQPASQQ